MYVSNISYSIASYFPFNLGSIIRFNLKSSQKQLANIKYIFNDSKYINTNFTLHEENIIVFLAKGECTKYTLKKIKSSCQKSLVRGRVGRVCIIVSWTSSLLIIWPKFIRIIFRYVYLSWKVQDFSIGNGLVFRYVFIFTYCSSSLC